MPTGAILSDVNLLGRNSIVPPYKNDLSTTLISTIIGQIRTKVNFGLTYDQVNQIWKNILPSDIGSSTDWVLKFTYSQGQYYINYRAVEYTFGSTKNTKFYFDPSIRVYNSATSTNIKDTIKVLKINSMPDSNDPLGKDVTWQVYNVLTQPDGYVDNSKVLVKFPNTQLIGVPDNPDLFNTIVGTDSTRSNLYFQYKHNVPARSRIDPTPVNIIDLYILTSAYSDSYMKYLRDLTGTIKEPLIPSVGSLEIDYNSLNSFKAVSDTIIFNPAKFKPLFGVKAEQSLRASFQVVKNANSGMTDNEIKTQVISTINTYFDPRNWDFGDAFYFSELAAYLHSTLAPNISSVIITPKSPDLVFGNFFQINAEPWEIITSAATVNDIVVVSAVTAATLNLGNPLVGTY